MGFKAPLAQVVERAILAITTLFAVKGETNLLPLGGLALLDKILDDTAFAGTLSFSFSFGPNRTCHAKWPARRGCCRHGDGHDEVSAGNVWCFACIAQSDSQVLGISFSHRFVSMSPHLSLIEEHIAPSRGTPVRGLQTGDLGSQDMVRELAESINAALWQPSTRAVAAAGHFPCQAQPAMPQSQFLRRAGGSGHGLPRLESQSVACRVNHRSIGFGGGICYRCDFPEIFQLRAIVFYLFQLLSNQGLAWHLALLCHRDRHALLQ